MIKVYIISVLISLLLSVVLGAVFIPVFKKVKAGQPILKYVEEHKDKSGTPTFGGLIFVISGTIVFIIFGGYKSRMASVACAIGLAFMVVGFIDDFLKIKFKKNEGLKPYQKIIFQFAIAVIASVFTYVNGITVVYIPFVKNTIDLGAFIIPISIIIFIAITNSVNLTDGLDGLAGGTVVSYLLALIILMATERNLFSYLYLMEEEYESLTLLSLSLIGAILGFLVFNINKASVFMGDTGSLSLGGFLGAISIFSSNTLFIPLIGIMFVVSSVSVIIQVVHFKRTKKRVFLMAPFHHHLQMKGLSESKISFYYYLITCIMGALSVIFYL